MFNFEPNLFLIITIVIVLTSLYRVFQKAGYDGWKALIPFYNLYIIQKIINKPWWWMVLMFIPYIGLIWTIWSTNILAKVFGKDELFTLGLLFLPFIFYPIIAFGNAKYDLELVKKKDQEITE